MKVVQSKNAKRKKNQEENEKRKKQNEERRKHVKEPIEKNIRGESTCHQMKHRTPWDKA